MSLGRYLLRRLVWSVVTLFGVIVTVFVVTRVLPGDPVLVKAGAYATPEIREAISKQLGLDKPFLVQLITYVGDVLRGDLGESIRSGHPVREDLSNRLPATIELALAALFFAGTIGIPLGIWAAVRRGSWIDGVVHQVAIVGAATPLFWFGLVLIYLFYHLWHIAPAPVGRLATELQPPRDLTGLYTVDALVTGNWTVLRDALAHLALPTFALGFVVMSPFIKMSRSAMLNVLESDYVLAARSLGLSDREIVRQDALKNALVSLLTVTGIVLGYLLAGNVLVETIFSWPGIGYYAWNAITGSDYDAINGFVLVVAIIYVVLNVVIDVAYTLIDPRIRLG
ncbi:MAG: peptide/nickel transport system permease protein [Thermomicrobiales bacterium]|jgi:peptide/nickel transport system permease protein|nr:peptide/nickel transport system permease protein [Thermomicrobiales bacterium]MEA2527957.1 peptide/nickel transport system permease protein [Thermomicrobiales bacterium]